MCCEQYMDIACGILVHAISIPYAVNRDFSSKTAALTPMGWNMGGTEIRARNIAHLATLMCAYDGKALHDRLKAFVSHLSQCWRYSVHTRHNQQESRDVNE